MSVIPVAADGSKAPAVRLLPWEPETGRRSWNAYRCRLADADELYRWFRMTERIGVGAVTGAVSGGLEAIDCDTKDVAARFEAAVEAIAPGLVLRLVRVETPRGRHFYYRTPRPAGCGRLAGTADGTKSLIDRKGEGGYLVAHGSHPECNPRPGGYAFADPAGFAALAVLSDAERDALAAAAAGLDEGLPPARPSAGRPNTPSARPLAVSAGDRPGDAFDTRAVWEDVLGPSGWAAVGEGGGVTYWRRPGKRDGVSATTGYLGGDRLYVFSTAAAPLEPGRAYTKFQAYALLAHRGDFRAAARALRAGGFGSTRPAGRLGFVPLSVTRPVRPW